MAKIRDKQKDADYGRVLVDEQLEQLESRLSNMYAQAGKECKDKFDKYLDQFDAKDKKMKEAVADGTMSQEDYKEWKNRRIWQSDSMTAQINDINKRLINADKQATAMINDQLPETYATAYNFGGFRGEQYALAGGYDYTAFTIINQDAVRTLAKEDPDLIPWKIDPDIEESERWNRQRLQSAISQGILQGESMNDVAKRLLPVVNGNANSAIRTARTAINGVENKGRKDATERVRQAGIPMNEMWSCTHDARTRDTHILLDKTTPNEKGLFGEGILATLIAYPADPSGDPEEIYNCRCALVSAIAGIDHSKDDELYEKMMSEQYYDDWVVVKEQRDEKEQAFQAKKEGARERVDARNEKKLGDLKPAEDLTSGKTGIVQGKDISETWERRSSKFEYAIDDIIDAQGFNGLPKVASGKEFEDAVKESNIIAVRGYKAPDEETLNAYHEQLVSGDWYINCSVGGSLSGQGMYAAGNYGTELGDIARGTAETYSGENGRVETMTFTSDINIITQEDLYAMKADLKYQYAKEMIGKDLTEEEDLILKAASNYDGLTKEERSAVWSVDNEVAEAIEKEYDNVKDSVFKKWEGLPKDNGQFAALFGYDMIEVSTDSRGSKNFVVLNRTKVILKGD